MALSQLLNYVSMDAHACVGVRAATHERCPLPHCCIGYIVCAYGANLCKGPASLSSAFDEQCMSVQSWCIHVSAVRY